MSLSGMLTETLTRDLIRQTAQGNQPAFEELCRAYERPLLRVALRILHNPETAQDVVQEVLLAIWEGSKNFKGDSKPFTWMWAIVRHKAMDALRSTQRPTAFTERPPHDNHLKEKPELDAVICEALKELSPEHRLVVILTYYLNLSQHHVSRILQCPVGTVKSRLSHALRQLREMWSGPLRLESIPLLPGGEAAP